MILLRSFFPILLFIGIFAGSGIYFSCIGTANAFYQLSPLTAILPAIAVAWILHKGTLETKLRLFLDGVRHRDIITMCIIFLLAGAFGEVTKEIGSVTATVNCALSIIPQQFLLVGLFLIAMFISMAIGTSMGTIATIAPIAAGLSNQEAFSAALGVATVISGAMFGDNLSIISDTTIASVLSQEADPKKKLKLNAKIAIITAILTIVILLLVNQDTAVIIPQSYSAILITPYILLLLLALHGTNVFIALVVSTVFAWLLGWVVKDYGIISFSNGITKGFANMQEIMLLSLMVGGLSGLANDGVEKLAHYFGTLLKKHDSKMIAQLLIAKMASIFDILLANNTIAIIFCGKIAKDIAKQAKIPAHYTATWLDTFSCVFQGIIPYGAQVLLSSTIAEVSPLSVIPHVYYCYLLAIVAVLHICLKRKLL